MAVFGPGTLVLSRRHPFEALAVVTVEPNGMVHCRRDNMDAWIPAANLMPALPGWQDAPQPPTGHAASGLSQRDWENKRAADDADPEYVRAVIRFCRARIRWAHEWLRQIDPAAAEREINGCARVIAERAPALGQIEERRAA